MSVVCCVYRSVPTFPASDQHPDAVRYQIGDLYVDAIGGEPTLQEVKLVLNPPTEAPSIEQKLEALGLTADELKQVLGIT